MAKTIEESARKSRVPVSRPAHSSATASTAQVMVIQFDSSCTGMAMVTKVSAVPSVTRMMRRSDGRSPSSARATAA
jgi:hypothetical protein